MQWRYGRVRVNFGGVVGVSRNIVPRQRSGTGMHAGPPSGTKLDTCSTVACLSPCRETCLTPLFPLLTRTRLCYAWGLAFSFASTAVPLKKSGLASVYSLYGLVKT